MERLSLVARHSLPVVYLAGVFFALVWFFTSSAGLLYASLLFITVFWGERQLKMADRTREDMDYLKMLVPVFGFVFIIFSPLKDNPYEYQRVVLLGLGLLFILYHAPRIAKAWDDGPKVFLLLTVSSTLVVLPLALSYLPGHSLHTAFACALLVLYGEVVEVYGRKFCVLAHDFFDSMPDTAP